MNPLLPSCIGEILVRTPTPNRSAHRSTVKNSVIRSPQSEGVLASNGACEQPTRIYSLLASDTVSSQLNAATQLDRGLCPLRQVSVTPLRDEIMSPHARWGESDSDSVRYRNAKKGSSGPVTPHAKKLVTQVRSRSLL